MKKRIITVLLAGMMVAGLVGCGSNAVNVADSESEVIEQMVETEEAQVEKTVEVQSEEAKDVQVEENVQEDIVEEKTEEIAEVATEQVDDEKIKEQLSDMLINYKDRVDKKQASYGSLPSQFLFADINSDEYPELFLLNSDGVITVLTYYNGDAWDVFDAAVGGDWMSSCNTCSFNVNGGKIRAFKNVDNRYEENYLYEYVMGEYGPSLEVVKYTTTINDEYMVGVDFSHKQEVTRADYEKFLEDMNEEYEVTLTGNVNDGYFTIDDAFEAYLGE